MLRLALPLVAALLLLPLFFGTAGVLLPAFGYNPAVETTGAITRPLGELWREPGILPSLFLTLTSGIGATLVSLALALLIASGCWQTRWWLWLRASLPPVLAIPHVAFAIGMVFLFSPSGWLVRLLTPWLTGWQRPPDWQVIQDPLGLALTLAMVLKETPFLLLMCLAAFTQIDLKRQMWIGRSLGYRPMTVWWKLLLPQLYPLIRLPVLAVLVYSLSVVDMAILLGPNRPPTFAVMVFEWFREPDLALLNRAAAGALVLLAVTGFMIGGCLACEKAFFMGMHRPAVNGSRGGRGHILKGAARFFLLIGGGVSLGVLVGLVCWSLTQRWRFPDAFPALWTLAHWGSELPYSGPSVWHSIVLALASSSAALILVMASLEYQHQRGRRWPLFLLVLPLLLPQLPMMFGLQVATVLAGLDTRYGVVVWGHLMFVFPYVYLCLQATWFAYDERYVVVARSLGHDRLTAWWRIKLPMLLQPVLFSWAVGFAVSVAQFLPTLMLGGGRVATITTEAVAIGSGVDRRLAAIYALMQLALPALAYALALLVPRVPASEVEGVHETTT